MIFDDLREFLERLKTESDLLQIDRADWNLELGAITHMLAEKSGPALLFDNIKGYPQGYRVVTNLYTTIRRFTIALGMSPETDKMEIIKWWRSMDAKPIKPVEVKTGPVMENIYLNGDVNLLKFPVPRFHEGDGGRYMGTGHIVVTRDPDEGWVNAGVQRAMLHDKNTLGLYISPGKHNRIIREKYWAKGKACPVVMAFSPDPIMYLAGALHVAWGISEFDWAGGLRNRPIEVIKGEITGLPFPVGSEIVIEGECPPPEVEVRMEGPYTEWTGYYAGGARPEPVVRVKALYHRNDPILFGMPNMRPPLNQFPIPTGSLAALWNNLEGAGLTGIKGVWAHAAGGPRMILAISITQDHAGQAKQVGHVAAGSHGGGYMSQIIIVVDDDIDPTDINDVMWAVATRCNFETSVDIIEGWWGTRLDPKLPPDKREAGDFTHSIMIIDACKPFHWRDRFPPVNRVSPELRTKIMQKWGSKIDLLKD